ncbi:MAG: hypothetical protein NTV51_19450, partial [Verrucomicrobia bacterium]|nr:hypothetical protein [Verrucomicrobiota bacterium]
MNVSLRVESPRPALDHRTVASKLLPLLARAARCCVAFAACVVALHLSAQTTGSLRGVITDANAGTPVANALVRVEGTGLETTTDNT